MLVLTRAKGWWAPLFGDRGHVDAIVRSRGMWLHYQPGIDMTHVEVLDNWRDGVPDGAEVVRFRVLRERRRYRAPQIIAPMTCVEQIKALLAIGSPWILTPRQLMKAVQNG